MARRRRRNPKAQDWMPIAIGAVGGGLAVWVYLKGQTAAPATNTVSVTTPTLPTVTTTPATG